MAVYIIIIYTNNGRNPDTQKTVVYLGENATPSVIDVTDDVIIVTEPPTVAPGAVSIETDVIYGKGSGSDHNKVTVPHFYARCKRFLRYTSVVAGTFNTIDILLNL